jgi:hypothetical protein
MYGMYRKRILLLPLFLLGGFLLLVLLVSLFPGTGAALASPLRRVIGNEGVAQLETLVFGAQDKVQRVQYELGLVEPESPWDPAGLAANFPAEPATSTPVATRQRAAATPTTAASPFPTSNAGLTQDGGPTPPPTATDPPPTPTSQPTPTAIPPWTLPAVPPFGELEGEGVWSPYLTDLNEKVVAVRTFLQPDPERPYALVGIVAFDLRHTELHYVLGAEEPSLPGGPRGTGRIPDQDMQPGWLLATFNGGFLATHGEYGAMADGLVALPAKPGYGTVTIDHSGALNVGAWADTIDPVGTYRSWRQNARMVIENGVANDRVDNGSILTWGGSINGEVVTWRSGLALNQARDVLFFLAGPSMSMPILAESMLAVGATDGILLDINASWVHFAAVRAEGNDLVAEPLFPEGMETNPDRYLRQSGRDFFYVTTRAQPAANNSTE